MKRFFSEKAFEKKVMIMRSGYMVPCDRNNCLTLYGLVMFTKMNIQFFLCGSITFRNSETNILKKCFTDATCIAYSYIIDNT